MMTRCWSPKHRRRTFEKTIFYWVTQSSGATLNRCTFGAPITRMETKPQIRELDLESLGWLFQNQRKDWGLVGDRYPPGPLEDKKASRNALGPGENCWWNGPTRGRSRLRPRRLVGFKRYPQRWSNFLAQRPWTQKQTRDKSVGS
jgi:hypothetical protein